VRAPFTRFVVGLAADGGPRRTMTVEVEGLLIPEQADSVRLVEGFTALVCDKTFLPAGRDHEPMCLVDLGTHLVDDDPEAAPRPAWQAAWEALDQPQAEGAGLEPAAVSPRRRFSSPLACEVSLKPPQKWLMSSGLRRSNGVKGGSEPA
jgi:hypothetical protein